MKKEPVYEKGQWVYQDENGKTVTSNTKPPSTPAVPKISQSKDSPLKNGVNQVSMASANLGAGRTRKSSESLREGIRYHTNRPAVEKQRQRADYTQKSMDSMNKTVRGNNLVQTVKDNLHNGSYDPYTVDEWSSGVWKNLTDPYKKELEKQGVYGVGLQESKEEYERLNKLKTEEILDEWDKKTGDKNKFWNKVNRGLNDAVLDPKGVDNWTGGSLPKVTAKYHPFWTERKLGVGFDQTAAQQSSEKAKEYKLEKLNSEKEKAVAKEKQTEYGVGFTADEKEYAGIKPYVPSREELLKPTEKTEYEIGGKTFWAESSSIQGIGILENGQIVKGSSNQKSSDAQERLMKAVLNNNGTIASEKNIDELADIVAKLHGRTDAEYKKNIKNPDYYTIYDYTDIVNHHMEKISTYYLDKNGNKNFLSAVETMLQATRNGSEGDLKNKPEYRRHNLFIYNGEIVDQDALGNIAYGHLGASVGLDIEFLLMTAGGAQMLAGTSKPEFANSYYDDPRDVKRIIQGYNLAKKEKGVSR